MSFEDYACAEADAFAVQGPGSRHLFPSGVAMVTLVWVSSGLRR